MPPLSSLDIFHILALLFFNHLSSSQSLFFFPNAANKLKKIMNLIDIVEKYDDSFKQLNKRILEIDSGILRYYSKVPQDFNPNNP